MSQAFRITVGTVVLAPIVAAFLLTGFPANAATASNAASLRDPRVSTRIDKTAKDMCRAESPGSVEHSVCLADARKDAYRAAADARRAELQNVSYAPR